MIRRLFLWLDDRLGTAHAVRTALHKAFPDHWSFMLGEINLYAFVVLVATGTFLALFFDPNAAQSPYDGPYRMLAGAHVSHAFASTMALSFEVRGGLLIRQVHHWTALVFVCGIIVHMGRVFFTGAFRKPRELNWVVGVTLCVVGLLAGFTGYSLPDDLLSGIGLRIADSVALSVPLIGTWASFLLLGGPFPTTQMLPRLFVLHVYLVPLTIAALIALHLAILWRQKHSQFPGPGRTERNVAGSPMVPQYAAKSLALFVAVVAVVVALGAFVQINPIWLWGPYEPWRALVPAQPDWYVGWLDGALRLGPPLALHLFGHTVPSPFWPAVLMPLFLFGVILLWPWIEGWITADQAYHQLLDRPRDVPARTAFGVAVLTFAGGLTLAGSGDVQARYLHQSIVVITHFYQVFCLVGPLVAFVVTYAFAGELRRLERHPQVQRVELHRNVEGGYDEDAIA
ncbi:MAG: cytochrome bc complex cytochrome b subunit [Candidatus Eremiobacteraeota bacterium]|nr:cytochrome bc complex cytochrome b subunit [Candidatus Eremiobacteraeota bacterium]